ncbi:hypothetical protein [Massilia sp. CCM 8734]|uniref:hypothetical protein n=1 Tax=Massilia sp. CCM 8734 TaxID=2609283 RepID=UPI001E5888F8|nr:hypothetical protein [Massilia sp. CCM 8734]
MPEQNEEKPGVYIVIRDANGNYYDIPEERFGEFRMSDELVEKFVAAAASSQSAATPQSAFVRAAPSHSGFQQPAPGAPAPGAFVRASPGAFVRASPGAFVRASPGAFVRAAPVQMVPHFSTSFARVSPGAFVRAAPGAFVRAAPGAFLRAAPGAFVRAAPSVMQATTFSVAPQMTAQPQVAQQASVGQQGPIIVGSWTR